MEAGFGPASVALIGSWAYMAVSALLIAEVNVNTLCALEEEAVSMPSMARETVGEVGAVVASIAYAFIHYALLIAYMLEGGKLVAELLPALGTLPLVTPTMTFAAIGGGSLLVSSAGAIEKANNALFAGVIASFVALVGVGAAQVSPEYLAHAVPAAALPALPVMVLSFTFHNVVPTITYQLGCDLPKIRSAILAGSAIPLVMFLAWNAVVLGSVPAEAAAAAAASGEIFDPLATLRSSGDSLGEVVRVFSLLAIVTSFIGFCLGLVDFYADLLGIDNGAGGGGGGGGGGGEEGANGSSGGRAAASAMVPATDADADALFASATASERPLPQKAGLYALVLLPPLLVASCDPSLFFAALDTAGTFGILTLFGILPALMSWSQRYGDEADPAVSGIVPGGKASLAVMIGGAAAVIGLEVAERVGAAAGMA
jgi:tyrosine-specific transport protein